LQFARPRNADLCPTDVKQAIDKTVNMVTNRLYKQKIELNALIDKDLPLISADPQQLEQVLVNLFLNAIDAMPNGGNLTVEARLKEVDGDARAVAITVIDNGNGIDETDLGKIFQPFFSAKKGKGIGLGLSICNRIIENHGGKISVESKPGKGTSFRIHLPLEQSHADVSATDRAPDAYAPTEID
jgi:signal transduction histidine kinase